MQSAAPALLLILALSLAPSASGEGVQTLTEYVTDLAGVLSPGELLSIEGSCLDLEEITSAEIAVLIVNSTYPLSIEQYAYETFSASGIGKAGKDNGILVLVAVGDSAWRIEVGYGLEGVLPDARVGNIGLDYLSPALDNGEYGLGIQDAVDALASIIVDEYEGSGDHYPIPGIPLTREQLIIASIVFVAVAILTRGRIFLWIGELLRRSGGGGGRSGGGGASGH